MVRRTAKKLALRQAREERFMKIAEIGSIILLTTTIIMMMMTIMGCNEIKHNGKTYTDCRVTGVSEKADGTSMLFQKCREL